MIITILEGSVSADKWSDLEISFREGIKHTPPQLKETYLIQAIESPETWRIITFWRSDQAYKEAKVSGGLSTGERIFHNTGVESTRREFRVILRHEHI